MPHTLALILLAAPFGAGGCGTDKPDFRVQGVGFYSDRDLTPKDFENLRAGIDDALDVAVVQHRKHSRKHYRKSLRGTCVTLKDELINHCGRHDRAWGCASVSARYISIAVRPPEDLKGEHTAAVLSHELRHILQYVYDGKIDYGHASTVWWRKQPHK